MSPREAKLQSSNNRALANQERQLQVERMNRMGHSMLILLATVLSFSCLIMILADQMYRPDAFVIDRLKIKGSFNYLKPQEIEKVVAEKQVGNFFSIRLADIKRRVEALPWVQDAQVRRQWPDTLLISVVEQRPVMRWGKSKWVNPRGDVIELPEQANLIDPIVLHGNESDAPLMMHQAKYWGQRLKKNGLAIKELRLSDSHAYRLRLVDISNDIPFELLLGRHQTETRLARFLTLFEQQFKGSNQQIQRVDARYPNGLAIKANPKPENKDLADLELIKDNNLNNQLVSIVGNH